MYRQESKHGTNHPNKGGGTILNKTIIAEKLKQAITSVVVHQKKNVLLSRL